MAVLFSLSERNWSVQTIQQTISVDAAAAEIVLSLAHPEWPVGEVARVRVDWPGSTGYSFVIGGGPRVVDKTLGTVMPSILQSTAAYRINKPGGITQIDAVIQIVQALRSAVLVESFG